VGANAAASSSGAASIPEAKTVKFAIAVHDGPENRLLVCTDIETTPEKAASVALPEGATRLNARCDTLGKPPLTTCTLGNVIEHYYVARLSDTYEPSCIERGGRWETNHGAEAEATRHEQAAP
jgi:hypothetical protein